MNRYLKSLWILPLAAAVFNVSCKPSGTASTPETPAGYTSVKDGEFKDQDFSGWLSKAGLQAVYDTRKAGTYFPYVEGRNNGGLHEYRHVTKPFTADKYSEFAVYWGLTNEEFYQVDLKMLRAGFIRSTTQVFVDGTGKAFHQVIWLKPKA